ncbi:hydrophobin [Coniophora puteana RWD-64-598 SS2]|uniref:Hydrophobin n=1 Tax=Coniophora puteana (strain RWD-64-598) TaxID=741705 RepID=A0A5M3M883_CONPW|nr:hydrophobin [Coniophora puteana RWD-64-598 SS2]EIW75084.1 hydrophobin [Coniophora puteana RWD-64-598 SS2]
MFCRLFALLPFVSIVIAGQCNTGSAVCCNSVQDVRSSPFSVPILSLGLSAEGVTGQVGLHCSPISALGADAGTCNQTPVCCTGNSYNSLINDGCSPIGANA